MLCVRCYEHLTMSFFCLERYGSDSCGSSSWSNFIRSELALTKCPVEVGENGLGLISDQSSLDPWFPKFPFPTDRMKIAEGLGRPLNDFVSACCSNCNVPCQIIFKLCPFCFFYFLYGIACILLCYNLISTEFKLEAFFTNTLWTTCMKLMWSADHSLGTSALDTWLSLTKMLSV